MKEKEGNKLFRFSLFIIISIPVHINYELNTVPTMW